MKKNKTTVPENRIIKKKLKKKGFPFGIFMLLLFVMSAIVIFATGAYFYFFTKNDIATIEENIQKKLLPQAVIVAEYAELSYKLKSYARLRSLFREKIENHDIDEAFFVLKNGKLIIHSDKEVEESLNGNIASDEFSYNTDLILKPVRTGSRKLQFSDYNVFGKRVPFLRIERKLLKKYLDEKIDIKGWLISKAVFKKGRPVGTVNFIISKDRLYNLILQRREESKWILIYSLAGSFLVSLAFSFIIFFRYRSIQNSAIQFAETTYEQDEPLADIQEEEVVEEEIMTPEYDELVEEESIVIPIDENGDAPKDEDDGVILELMDESDDTLLDLETEAPGVDSDSRKGAAIYSEGNNSIMDREIKDAIPISRRNR